MSNKESSRPNILWIFSDQHRAQALSCYGDENIQTPHLDRIAREGIRFTNAFSNSPLCAPFRATLYTGEYITSHGVKSLYIPIKHGQRMLAEELRDLGYYTSHMGKWHLSGGKAPTSFVSPYFRPGWDEWLGWENSNRPWDTEYQTDPQLPPRTLEGYQTDALTDLTVAWLKEQPADRPWFHVVSIEPPHPPNTAPDRYLESFRDKPLKLRPNVPTDHPRFDKFMGLLRSYYAQIANLDDNVGRILQALEETGQLERTIIFYFSDHGDLMGSHGRKSKSRPELESSNIPLMIRYPARVPQGQVSDSLISGVDIMPTLLGLIGADIPASVQGADLSRTVLGLEDCGAKSVLLQYEYLFYGEATEETIFRTFIQGEWHYTYYLTAGPFQLFNVKEDPYQMNNRIHDPLYETVQASMHAGLAAKLEELGDDFLIRSHRRLCI